MAGLDPAAPATHALVEAMLARKDPSTGHISFDACMQVACHYQVKVRGPGARGLGFHEIDQCYLMLALECIKRLMNWCLLRKGGTILGL